MNPASCLTSVFCALCAFGLSCRLCTPLFVLYYVSLSRMAVEHGIPRLGLASWGSWHRLYEVLPRQVESLNHLLPVYFHPNRRLLLSFLFVKVKTTASFHLIYLYRYLEKWNLPSSMWFERYIVLTCWHFDRATTDSETRSRIVRG